MLHLLECTDGSASAIAQLAKVRDQRGRNAIELGVEVPQAHLLEIIVWRLRSLSIVPRYQGKQWPPRVSHQGNSAFAQASHRRDGIIQPFTSPRHRTDGGGFGNKHRGMVTLPIHLTEL